LELLGGGTNIDSANLNLMMRDPGRLELLQLVFLKNELEKGQVTVVF
jgi:hypothetical protein